VLLDIIAGIPLSPEGYNNLYFIMVFVAVFALLFVIIYLMVGEEREETET